MVYDLIIIGAGPAGITAGIYASRQRLNVLIISKDIGGQVAKKAVDIENYPGFEKISGPDLVAMYQKQIEFNNLKVVHDEVSNIEKRPLADSREWVSGENKDNGKNKEENTNKHSNIIENVGIFSVSCKSEKTYEAVAVIIASGAESKKIKVPGEEKFAGKGVSYCSLCDGPVFKNKVVAVIGGGNNGFESALFLSNYVNKIYILEYSEKAKADAENQKLAASHKNIEVITSAKLLGIEGQTFVNAIVYGDLKTGEEKKLEVGGVFVEIGYSPSSSFAKNLVETNENGEIVADPKTLETKTAGLFSAGDCNTNKYKQIIMASGQGAVAALSAYEYIKKRGVVKNHYE